MGQKLTRHLFGVESSLAPVYPKIPVTKTYNTLCDERRCFSVSDTGILVNSLRTGSRLRGAQQIYWSVRSAGNEMQSAQEGEPARNSQNFYCLRPNFGRKALIGGF